MTGERIWPWGLAGSSSSGKRTMGGRDVWLRLTEAREAKGLTMAELATVLDISRQAISSFEIGIKTPSHETLMVLTKILGFPERFFVSNNSSPEIVGAVHFRSRSTATKKARMSGRARGRWIALILKECSKYSQLPPVTLPDLDIADFNYSKNLISKRLPQKLEGTGCWVTAL